MRALFPEERAEVLALHPGVTEDELDAFEARAHALQHAPPGPETDAAEAELLAWEQRMFPRYKEALTRVAWQPGTGGVS
jgi:hypothetical protein